MSKMNDLSKVSEKLREHINNIQDLLNKAINTYLNNEMSTSVALVNTRDQLLTLKKYVDDVIF